MSSEKVDKIHRETSHEEDLKGRSFVGGTDALAATQAENARLANPLAGKSDEELRLDAQRFCMFTVVSGGRSRIDPSPMLSKY